MGSLCENVDTAQQLWVTGLYSRFRPEPFVEGEDQNREMPIGSSTGTIYLIPRWRLADKFGTKARKRIK